MKELQHDTNFTTAVQDAPTEEQTVSFAPEEDPVDRLANDTECDAPHEECAEEEEYEIPSRIDLDSLAESDFIDTEEADTENGDNWNQAGLVYDVPRPALTIDEAATILGKSVRAVERGITGKWGNRLPEGWKARKFKIDGQDEWRIIPPPSFRIRHSKSRAPRTEAMNKTLEKPTTASQTPPPRAPQASREDEPSLREAAESLFGFSFNSLLQTAGKKAKNEIARAAEYAMESAMEHPTIVIDRSDEVERLLRELAETQKELSEERRLHLEDLRLLAEMQGSMRLLEMKSSQTATLKEELLEATRALQEHRRQYQEFLALPWWKRLFKKSP